MAVGDMFSCLFIIEFEWQSSLTFLAKLAFRVNGN